MGVSLSKGGNVSLSKEAPGLTAVLIGLGWDIRTTTGADFDLDASALLLRRRRARSAPTRTSSSTTTSRAPTARSSTPATTSPARARATTRPSRSNLAAVPADVDKIVFAVTIHDADTRGQNFGQVRNAFIRVVNDDNGAEIARYDLSEDASTETAMIFGELYRHGAEWKFRAVGQGYASGLARHRPRLRRQRLSGLDTRYRTLAKGGSRSADPREDHGRPVRLRPKDRRTRSDTAAGNDRPAPEVPAHRPHRTAAVRVRKRALDTADEITAVTGTDTPPTSPCGQAAGAARRSPSDDRGTSADARRTHTGHRHRVRAQPCSCSATHSNSPTQPGDLPSARWGLTAGSVLALITALSPLVALRRPAADSGP